jgi:hypothetical protein
MDYSLRHLPPTFAGTGAMRSRMTPSYSRQRCDVHGRAPLAMLWYGKRTVRAYAVPDRSKDRSNRYRRRPSEFGLHDVRW